MSGMKPSEIDRPNSLRWAGLSIVGIPALLVAMILLGPTPQGSSAQAAPEVTATQDQTTQDQAASFAIVGAKVFDGAKVFNGANTHQEAAVWVEDGHIRAVGQDLDLPDDLERINGSGHTLLPGLLDAHVHTWGDARSDAVRFGVTTLLDQFTSPSMLQQAKKYRDKTGETGLADLFSAGFLATVDGGHGTQFGVPVPQVEGPEAAAEWVKARKAEGSDWIKIVVEPGWGRSLPTLDPQTTAAVIEAAHAQGLKAVVHASLLDDALRVAEMGADGLVHVWRDREITDAEVKVLKNAGLFVIPTLVVMEGMVDPGPSLAMVEGPLGSGLSAAQKTGLERRFPPSARVDWAAPAESVRKLAAAGIPILAGSDAPNPSTAMGFSLHRELQLLTQSGLSPEQALRSATSLAADHFGVPKRGRIAQGMLADLVLVKGDPTVNITDSQRIRRVWKAGREVNLEAVEQTAPEVSSADAPSETLLADFETGLVSRFGHGWMKTTDDRMGGKSVVDLQVEAGALGISGELLQGSMFPWAGAMVFLGSDPMQAVDFSARQELRFRARGDGRTYSVMLFSGDMQGIPPTLTFETSGEWTPITLPLADFKGADTGSLRGISFAATGKLGTFSFEIDDVEIR